MRAEEHAQSGLLGNARKAFCLQHRSAGFADSPLGRL